MIDLKPRAAAVLVAMRREPLTTIQIRNAIADASISNTRDLISDMCKARDGFMQTPLIAQIPGDARWYLTHDGLGWLQTHGLDPVAEARLYVAQELAEA